jgi:two-component system sensor histidine kinase PilS (NtrC family)
MSESSQSTVDRPKAATDGASGPQKGILRPAGDIGQRSGPRRVEFGERGLEILRWIYMARLGLAGGLFSAAVLAWTGASPALTLTASLALVITLLHTAASYWLTHIRKRAVGETFAYGQAIVDVLLVTLIIDLTGGRYSVVAPLYILLISAYTLMLPLRSSLLVTGLACIAFIADAVWIQGAQVDTVVVLQLAIFVGVAVVVGVISTKLREAGAALTSVEDELRQLRLETGDILGNIPTAILTVDAEGRLVYANPAAERLLGFDVVSYFEKPVMEQLAQRSAGLQKALDRTRRYRIPVASAEISVHRRGDDIPVGISTAVLDRREGTPSVTAIMRDISDRKRIEGLRQRTERLEAVAELSASLAHEIKNPLASISSSVQQMGLKERADEDDQLLSRLILRESDRLSRLLADFIDFARLRVERSKLLDLREVAAHGVQVVRRHPAFRDEIEVEIELADEPVLFEGDEDLMHRVVTNLVLNAVQASESSPTRILVEVTNENSGCVPGEVDVEEPVVLRVTDDGPGIPQGDLVRIFDPFFTKRRGGSGLGLAIVHRAVREHGGMILVASDSEIGTRFTVCLPRSATNSEGTAAEEQ